MCAFPYPRFVAISSRLFLAAGMCAIPALGKAATIADIYVFQDPAGGFVPASGLISDAQGRLYGVAVAGGANNNGVVYRLVPPVPGQTQWTEEVLHTFDGADGAAPEGTLVMDSQGSLYGTAEVGGSEGHGLVFKLTNTTGWPLTILHDFGDGKRGGNPSQGVTFGPDNLLYGVSGDFGGATHAETGTTFSLSPLGDNVEFAVLHAFGKSPDGVDPIGLNVAPNSTLIGATLEAPLSDGTIFVQRVSAPGTASYKIAYTFQAVSGVSSPEVGESLIAPLVGRGALTNLYLGTAGDGGEYGRGGVYSLSASSTGDIIQSVLFSFAATSTAPFPSTSGTPLVQVDTAGLLAGTTPLGGTYGQGTLYELAPPKAPGGSWTETTLGSFTDKGNGPGANPIGNPIKVGQNYFGVLQTTQTGQGAIYMITP